VIASSENSRPIDGKATPIDAPINGVKNELSMATSKAALLSVCVPAGRPFVFFVSSLSIFNLLPVFWILCAHGLNCEILYPQYTVEYMLATHTCGCLTRYDPACYTSIMPSVTPVTFETLAEYCSTSAGNLYWSSVFVLPAWLKTWWQHFGTGRELYLAAVNDETQIIGVASLLLNKDTASIIGSDNVCDYVDFVVTPGREHDFFRTLLDELSRKKIRHLNLGLLRPDSTVLTSLANIVRKRGMQISCRQEDVSYEMDLPLTWDDYLELLNAKQRHEVRRKLRRLAESGEIRYRLLKGQSTSGASFKTFMQLFSLARVDKSSFMTVQMAGYFNSLATTLTDTGLLRIGLLEFNSQTVAAVMCFDYNSCIYLYNSGYDPEYESLSVGLLSKILCIKESIQEGKKRFEFLKGNEVYKERLGGKEIPLNRCQIVIA
jgi:CelD/BcsL family acetyltransferase involved in cellulose biosynthesis